MRDIVAAGKLYYANSNAGGSHATSSRYLPSAFASPLDLLIHCVDNILRDLDVEDMGASHRASADLYLLHYLSVVIRQDADARIQLHDMLQSQSQPGSESQRNKSPFDQSISQRSALLGNSLIWRIFASTFSDKKTQESFVRGLVRLITHRCIPDDDDSAANTTPSDHKSKGLLHDEEVMVRSTLTSHLEIHETAKTLLKTMFDIFGRAEGNGAFLCNSKHRKASINLRMSLDAFLIDAFWSEKGYCKEPEAARILLQALHPSDRLRFIGLMVAHKFVHTYSSSTLTTKSPLKGVEVHATFADVTNYMHRINDIMVSQGKDVDGFFEVDMTQVLMALNYEPNRAIKTYKSINHVALMLEVIATSVSVLAASQQAVPTGFQTLPQFGEELKKAVRTFTAVSKEHHDVAYALSVQATCDLVITLNVTKSICALSS